MPTVCEEIRRRPDGQIPIEQAEAVFTTSRSRPQQIAGRIALLALLLACAIPAYAQVPRGSPVAPQLPQSQPPPPEAQVPDPHDAMEQEPTRLQIRGFGDVQFRASNQ